MHIYGFLGRLSSLRNVPCILGSGKTIIYQINDALFKLLLFSIWFDSRVFRRRGDCGKCSRVYFNLEKVSSILFLNLLYAISHCQNPQ